MDQIDIKIKINRRTYYKNIARKPKLIKNRLLQDQAQKEIRNPPPEPERLFY